MSEVFMEVELEMQDLTKEYVKKLIDIWMRIFNKNICKENLAKLVNHAKHFYEDLVAESMEKETIIEKHIKDLQEETNNLQGLLMIDNFVLTSSESIPLLERQSELEKYLSEFREKLRLRREQIYKFMLEQEALCDVLGQTPRAMLLDPLPSIEEIRNFEIHLENLRSEKDIRLRKFSDLRCDIKEYLKILELQVSIESEKWLLNDHQIKLTDETFKELNKIHHRFYTQVKDLEEKINILKHKLETLWNRLDASPSTRNNFKKCSDYSQTTFDILNREFNRCEFLKSQNIKLYVNQVRQEIIHWWTKTLKSDKEKSRFSNFNSNCYTDDLLVLHEMELDDLKTFYNNNKQIFELYSERQVLWNRMIALESKASEPGRYNNRGGQLLKEERERKTIATKLPKIEAQIKDLVNLFEEREHKSFLVNGDNILHVIEQGWIQKRIDKEKISSARKNAQTPLSNTFITNRTPILNQNEKSSLIRKTPSTNNLLSSQSSNKRKIISTESHASIVKRSLLTELSSPGCFLKPARSPLKKRRVIATTVRRQSDRHSSVKKRRSVFKIGKTGLKVGENAVDTDTNDATYNSFQKCIEPASRSSLIQSSDSIIYTTTRSNMVLKKENEDVRLPISRLNGKSPRYNKCIQTWGTSPASPATSSPLPLSIRKLTTKNLPIII